MQTLNGTTLNKGTKVKYERELMFGKGIEIVEATVVMVANNTALLDNGDEITVY